MGIGTWISAEAGDIHTLEVLVAQLKVVEQPNQAWGEGQRIVLAALRHAIQLLHMIYLELWIWRQHLK